MSKIRYLFWIIYTQPLYIIWLAIILAIVFWSVLMLILRKYPKTIKVLNGFFWIGCSLAIIFITLMTRNGTISQIKLLPFYSFKEAVEYPEMYRAMVMNIFLFTPFGLTLPYVLSGRITKKGVFTCFFATLFSLIIELFQLYFSLGRCEVDDIIMNTVGALLGVISYFIYIRLIDVIDAVDIRIERKKKMTTIEQKNKTILITGAAGFIGSNLVLELLKTQSPITIVGIDNMNDYYDVSIKEWRLTQIEKSAIEHLDSSWIFIRGDIADKAVIDEIFTIYHPDIVVNLAAQAGVRYSITNPDAYINSNLIGFYNILEACRHSYDNEAKGVEHLVYASSSSVYGSNKKVPYSTDDKVDNPVSLYAATKKSNELMAHAYSKLYNIPSTGLRFFTVYGPAGRPDMAYFGFTNKLLKGETIQIFNYGNCKRDFTYVDDIVEGVKRVMAGAPERKIGEDGLPVPPYAIYNIGNQNPENLLDFVDILQQELMRAEVLPTDYDFEAHKELVPMQPGDVPVTYADTSALERDFGFKPSTDLRTGLRKFAEWYKEFYGV